MAIRDISWGAVIVGAAAVTAFVAMAPAAAIGLGSGTILAAMTAQGTGLTAAAALGGAAVAGGIAGEFVSDLLKRGRDACATLIEPRR